MASPRMSRLHLSVFDGNVMRQWPCECRYTVEEVTKIQAGDHKGACVTKNIARTIIQVIDSLHDERIMGEMFSN